MNGRMIGMGFGKKSELESAARRYDQFYIRLLDTQGKTLLETSRMSLLLPASQFVGLADRMERIRSASGAWYLSTEVTAPVGEAQALRYKIQIAVSLALQQQILLRYRKWLWAILSVVLYRMSSGWIPDRPARQPAYSICCRDGEAYRIKHTRRTDSS